MQEAKADELMEEDRRRGLHMDAKETYMRRQAAKEAQEQLEDQILERGCDRAGWGWTELVV